MKTTIEIADDLFERTQRLAREQKTSFRVLTEAVLRLVLAGKQRNQPGALPPLVTFGGGGPTDEFKDRNWDQVRDGIYRSRRRITPGAAAPKPSRLKALYPPTCSRR
ncbi:MAG: hypothetical protein KDM81_12035 [Verrucomicrobiae bacterium]|nr:hypothetical protein [Verrucomicrobiae bacterium]MCP5518305.1 hypothetical protein [Verrucomicrobiales bacterium]